MSLPSSNNLQISGFYGPGPWAAWMITLGISWINTIQNDYTHNMHFIAYALYTNFAAIDLIRQLNLAIDEEKISSVVRLNPGVPMYKIDWEQNPLEVDEATRQILAAAIAVVHVGIQTATVQIIACFYKERQQNFDPKEPIKRRRFILSVGLVLPIAAIWYASIWISFDRLGLIVLPGSLLPGLTTLIPSWVNILWSWKHNNVKPDSFLAKLSVFLAIVNWAVARWAKPRLQFRNPGNSLLSRDLCSRKECCFVPCAQQSMGEMDQIFSLVITLSLFLYEFESQFARVARKCIGAARKCIKFLLETRFGSLMVHIVRIWIEFYHGSGLSLLITGRHPEGWVRRDR
jgi:hypothetical protein